MSNRISWDRITKEATTTYRSWSNKQVAQFHYFNPNGLVEQKRQLDLEIDRLVEEGKLKGGSILAHGGLATFEVDSMREVATQGRRVGSTQIIVAIKMLEDKIKRVQEFVAQHQ